MKRGEGGFSLIEIMIALGLLTFLGLALSRMLGDASRSAQSINRIVDMKTLSKTLSENVDCQKTLGTVAFGQAGFTPLQCSVYSLGSLTLRRKDASAFPNSMGNFEIRAGCVDNSLRIEARKKDPMLQQNVWTDVFSGTSELCRHYFTPGPVCPPGEGIVGNAGAIPVCGKLGNPLAVITRTATGGGNASSATVQCLPNELRLACGGSRQPDLKDTCPEEDCGLVGVMPVGPSGCRVAIDSDRNTNPTVYAMCLPLR